VNPDRFQAITRRYASLRIAVVGDFCLDRYFDIDPARQEISIETGLPVHNVVGVRNQPGGAGTIVNNLSALQVGTIYPVGFAGDDAEGFELCRTLKNMRGVRLGHFFATEQRRTFTYMKPLIKAPEKPPVELNRIDLKNWTPTPAALQGWIVNAFAGYLSAHVDAIIILDQVDIPETGVVTAKVLQAVHDLVQSRPNLLIVADSRRGLRGYPPVCFKMNRAELNALAGCSADAQLEEVKAVAGALSDKQGRNVFVTLSEDGILGASPDRKVEHIPALPVRGPIDVVGAGDAVTANLTAALAAGATTREALEFATAAASIVVHQLGTTGTASVDQVRSLLQADV
jgi:rfaE bifunctional protein kinase chain/domain